MLREGEDTCIVMQSQMDGMQEQAEELLERKDIECQQIVEQMKTECQTILEEKECESDNDKAKLTLRLRDTQTDRKFDEGPTMQEETKIGKFRNSLDTGVADPTDPGRMVLAYGLSTKPMTRNVYRDKEQESNVRNSKPQTDYG